MKFLEAINAGDVYTDGKGRLYKYIDEEYGMYNFERIDAYGDKIGENTYFFDEDGHSLENASDDNNLCAYMSSNAPKHEPIWLAVDMDGWERVFDSEPYREHRVFMGEQPHWTCDEDDNQLTLPKGTIEKLVGRKLTWEDEPVRYNS